MCFYEQKTSSNLKVNVHIKLGVYFNCLEAGQNRNQS